MNEYFCPKCNKLSELRLSEEKFQRSQSYALPPIKVAIIHCKDCKSIIYVKEVKP